MSNRDKYEVGVVLPLNEKTVVTTFTTKEDQARAVPTQSVCVAAYVTSHARLHLLKAMEGVHEATGCLLYTDTVRFIFYYYQRHYYIITLLQDSVIYGGSTAKLPRDRMDQGSFLGQWSNELADDEYITDIVLMAPKTYSYRTKRQRGGSPHTVTKCKGKSKTSSYRSCRQRFYYFQVSPLAPITPSTTTP